MRRFNRLQDETGQVIAFSLVCMVVLIAMVGFAVDAGHAYLVQRQLQSGVDAAALAGAQELPDAGMATTVAKLYGPDAKNPPTSIDNAQTSVEMKCVKSAPGCSSQFGTYNAVQVSATSSVRTFFARVIGIDSIDVDAKATACSPCSAKPLDIMVVLDRTGSMCDVSANGKCRDMTNAVTGVQTFLGFMDPKLDEVGLSVFPPALDRSSLCKQPTAGAGNYGYGAYWPEWVPSPPRTPAIYAIASPDFNYSNMLSKLDIDNCLKPNGTTSYVDAIDEAQHELDAHGRGNVQDVIIILTDGAANESPAKLPSYVPGSHLTKPCTQGMDAAAASRSKGTIVFTIGYDVDADSNGGQCGKEGFNASWALQQMASEPDNYYLQPNPASLN